MVYFDVILVIDWSNDCFASIDCITRISMFNFPNEPVLERKEGNSILRIRIISCLMAYKIISKGCLCHIVCVKDLHTVNPSIELFLVVRELLEVFCNDLPVIPP